MQPLRPSSHRRPASLLSLSEVWDGFRSHFGQVCVHDPDRCSHGGSPACLPSAGGELVLLSGQVPEAAPLPRCQLVIFYPMLMMPQKKHRTSFKLVQGFRAIPRGPSCPTRPKRALSPSHDLPEPAILGGGGAGGQEKKDQRKEKGRLPPGERGDTSQVHARRMAPTFHPRVHLEPQGKFWAISVPPGGGCRSRMSWGGRGQKKKNVMAQHPSRHSLPPVTSPGPWRNNECRRLPLPSSPPHFPSCHR